MKKCIICKSVFPKEVENVWKFTCHRASCHNILMGKRHKKKREAKQKLWKNQNSIT